MEIVTADLYDQHHALIAVCDLQFRSFGRRPSFFGPCSIVRTFEDHTPVLSALSEPGEGRVLVVDGQGSLKVGLMGDRLAEIAVKSGWAGIVINGAVRDSVGIDRLDIGVKALGTTARRAWNPSPAARDVPVNFGSAAFKPGAWVYADVDSVIVSPHKLELDATPAPLISTEPAK